MFSEDGIRSRHYQLIAGDLRDMRVLGEKILSRQIDTRLVHYTPLLSHLPVPLPPTLALTLSLHHLDLPISPSRSSLFSPSFSPSLFLALSPSILLLV